MATKKSVKNVKWVEGLRGIASVLVLITHIARAFDYPLFFPADEASRSPRLLQLPILRVPAQGRIGVPIFAFLTGFVCALNPLKLARKGADVQQQRRRRRRQQQNQCLHEGCVHWHNREEEEEEEEDPWAYATAVRAVARSAFRRPPRLILPAALATLISFGLTLAGGYASANTCDSFWVRYDAPGQAATLSLEFKRLARTLLTTWTDRENLFDRHQWALLPLLVGAFQVYLVLVVTMGSRFRYRVVVHVGLLGYWWLNQEPFTETFGSMITLGSLLADLSLHRPTQMFIASRSRILSFVVAPLLILLGLMVASYPQEHEDWSAWSLWMSNTFVKPDNGSLLVPKGTDAPRRFTALGIQLCAIAVFLSPMLRETLSHRILLWFGHHSFAVYLTHGTILRTVGIWIAYGIRPQFARQKDGSYEEYTHVRSKEAVFTAVLVFIVLSYSVAWAWMRWVDSACAKTTQWLEAKVFRSEEEEEEEEDGDVEKAYRRSPSSEVLSPTSQDEGRGVMGSVDNDMAAGHCTSANLGQCEHDRYVSRGLLG